MTCTHELRAAGQPYPRTCPDCGLGPCKRMPQGAAANVTPLKVAEPPAKADILALLDEVRGATDRGEVLAVVIIPINLDKFWSTLSAGDIGMLELGGLLGRAWLTAMEAVKA